MTTADAPRRPRGRPGNDQETVLRRAIDLFNRQGYDATSISDLASDLGVTKSAVYHHFPSKEALLAAALDEALEGLTAAVASAAAATRDDRAYDRLRATVEAESGFNDPPVIILVTVVASSAWAEANGWAINSEPITFPSWTVLG